MARNYKIVIAGAGGIGRAAGLMLREIGDLPVDIYIGDANEDAGLSAAEWISKDSRQLGKVEYFHLPAEGVNDDFSRVLADGDILLDCLPGSQAPRMAKFARENSLHYANLTEYVKETTQVLDIANGAEKGFILQTGLAPGFVDVLAHSLYQQFCRTYGVDKVESVSMKVGALTQHATPPHFYGFTWSPVGVATLYVNPANVIREFEKISQPSLTERSSLRIRGIEYEEDLTSGGAADLPDALQGKTRNLDYKTLRYPGHYSWIDSVLVHIGSTDRVHKLQQRMEQSIPLTEEDRVVLYAAVEGADAAGKLRILEKSYVIEPLHIAGKYLRAIQATTASSLVESANMLLTGKYSGSILQSQMPCDDFLNGPYVSHVYK